MRFNNKELIAVAAQPSYKFDKEGILLLREKQEGLFRRSDVFQEKWFRLRGNLLFYYKNKDQYSEPAGVLVLEDCSVTLDSSTEVPFSFTLVFDGDEQGQQLAAFSETDRESWIQALQMASYEFMRSRLLSLKDKLENKLSQARLCSKERAKTLQCGMDNIHDRNDPLLEEPYLELCLACDNLQCDADGQPPSPVVYVFTLTPPSIEWTKFAHTEVVQKCSNPTFSTTVGFLKNEIHMSTRVKLSVYHIRERVTSTRLLLGEAVFTVGTLLQIKNSFMRLTLISPDCRSMGFITVMACELKSEAPTGFMGRQTKSASPQDGSIWLKVDRPRSYSLPTSLSSRANSPLYAYLRILYHNLSSQTYRFHTGLGAEVRVHEIMAEPRLAFLIPQFLLNLWIKEEQKLVDVLLNLGQLRPEWHDNHATAVDRHLQLINRYRESLEAILKKKNCYLKKSSQKADILLDFVPVNLHLQRLWAQNVTTRKTGVHDMITVGAFTAYAHDYKHGGLLRLLSQLKTTFPICNNGLPTGVLGPDPLSRAVEAIIRVEQLQSDMEVDLQQMLHFCSQRSASDMQTVVNSLSSKAKQLTLVCSAGLVEEALLAWEEVRPPEMVAPPRQNLAAMFGALSQPLDYCEKTLYVREKCLNGQVNNPTKLEQFEERKIIRKFEEGSIPIRKCVTNSPDHICKTSLADCLPSPVGSPEEFEPLDLTHLNIKASIMCMSSKIQNLTTLQQQQPNTQNCWVAELVPSVRKLRQAMQGLCRSAKLTYGLLAIKELPQHSTISREIRHRRDAVFSQALTSVVTGIMTLLWCRPADPLLLEQIIAAGLLIEFEGLLSCYGDNTGMLEDFVVAIDDLNRTNFWLESTVSKTPQPRVEGNRLFLSVIIPAPELMMSMLSDAYSKSCRFTASCMLFNIGINEKATLAEKFGDVSLQEKINSNSLNHLREYFRRVSRCSMNSKMGKISASSVANLLDKLQAEINTKKCKNVEILHLAAEICRRLSGIRFTSCKSAKDRTAMSVTLEQAIFLQKCFHLNNKEMLRALECMRSEGTRRENTFKNVGVRKYAFNGLQLMALPKLYRPPVGTYGNVQT